MFYCQILYISIMLGMFFRGRLQSKVFTKNDRHVNWNDSVIYSSSFQHYFTHHLSQKWDFSRVPGQKERVYNIFRIVHSSLLRFSLLSFTLSQSRFAAPPTCTRCTPACPLTTPSRIIKSKFCVLKPLKFYLYLVQFLPLGQKLRSGRIEKWGIY